MYYLYVDILYYCTVLKFFFLTPKKVNLFKIIILYIIITYYTIYHKLTNLCSKTNKITKAT